MKEINKMETKNRDSSIDGRVATVSREDWEEVPATWKPCQGKTCYHKKVFEIMNPTASPTV